MRSEIAVNAITAYIDLIIDEESTTPSNSSQDFFSRAAFLLTKEARRVMAMEIRDRLRSLHVEAKSEG